MLLAIYYGCSTLFLLYLLLSVPYAVKFILVSDSCSVGVDGKKVKDMTTLWQC